MPMKAMKGLIGAVALACAAASAQAETFKIGFMTTLTGPSAALGQHLRDGFLLGIREMNEKLGAFNVEVVIADDELKPDVAVTKIRALIERDRVDILGGIVFSNVMMAVYKPVRDADKIFVSGNAGPPRRERVALSASCAAAASTLGKAGDTSTRSACTQTIGRGPGPRTHVPRLLVCP
ncbi:MAG TPA: ABC transporter substrate-binding protein [Beijerinckiaceae bacterium]|nr:ABC transporter substrate-binding protein [Beijerinckiaceae bacterium]